MLFSDLIPIQQLKTFPFWKKYFIENSIGREEFQKEVDIFRNDLIRIGLNSEEIKALQRVPPPHYFKEKFIRLPTTIELFNEFENALEILKKKFELILVGGSALKFIDPDNKQTKDIDFTYLESPLRRLIPWSPTDTLKKILRLVPLAYVLPMDFAPNFQQFSMEFHSHRAVLTDLKNICPPQIIEKIQFRRLSIKTVQPLDMIYIKSLVGRDKDLHDAKIIIKKYREYTKELLSQRIVFHKGEVGGREREFIEKLFSDKEDGVSRAEQLIKKHITGVDSELQRKFIAQVQKFNQEELEQLIRKIENPQFIQQLIHQYNQYFIAGRIELYSFLKDMVTLENMMRSLRK